MNTNNNKIIIKKIYVIQLLLLNFLLLFVGLQMAIEKIASFKFVRIIEILFQKKKKSSKGAMLV